MDWVIGEIGFGLLRCAYACRWAEWMFTHAAIRVASWGCGEPPPHAHPRPESFATMVGWDDDE